MIHGAYQREISRGKPRHWYIRLGMEVYIQRSTDHDEVVDARGKSRVAFLDRPCDNIKTLAQISGICQGSGSTSGCLRVV